jgi:hypothetical protein
MVISVLLVLPCGYGIPCLLRLNSRLMPDLVALGLMLLGIGPSSYAAFMIHGRLYDGPLVRRGALIGCFAAPFLLYVLCAVLSMIVGALGRFVTPAVVFECDIAGCMPQGVFWSFVACVWFIAILSSLLGLRLLRLD